MRMLFILISIIITPLISDEISNDFFVGTWIYLKKPIQYEKTFDIDGDREVSYESWDDIFYIHFQKKSNKIYSVYVSGCNTLGLIFIDDYSVECKSRKCSILANKNSKLLLKIISKNKIKLLNTIKTKEGNHKGEEIIKSGTVYKKGKISDFSCIKAKFNFM